MSRRRVPPFPIISTEDRHRCVDFSRLALKTLLQGKGRSVFNTGV